MCLVQIRMLKFLSVYIICLFPFFMLRSSQWDLKRVVLAWPLERICSCGLVGMGKRKHDFTPRIMKWWESLPEALSIEGFERGVRHSHGR